MYLYHNILPLLFLSQVSNICGAYLDNLRGCTFPYSSNVTTSGTFSSPNYPQFYNARTHCRFDFVGRDNERVQIIFKDFNLYHPERNSSDCIGADTLSVFVYMDNNKLARIDDFCGSNTPLSVMSNGPKLTLEFNAPTSNRYVRGFSGIYNFVKDFGMRSGKQREDNTCSFDFNSSIASNGTFTSPNYPGLYPRETICHYYFHGLVNEYVELYFTYFHVDGVPPCDEETYSDYVEFSNYMPIDRKFDRQCGSLREKKIKSDRKFFRVTFNSNDKFDATGFHATYQFSDKSNHLTIRNIRTSGRAEISTKITQFLLFPIAFFILGLF